LQRVWLDVLALALMLGHSLIESSPMHHWIYPPDGTRAACLLRQHGQMPHAMSAVDSPGAADAA
jgi:hypothetical protein